MNYTHSELVDEASEFVLPTQEFEEFDIELAPGETQWEEERGRPIRSAMRAPGMGARAPRPIGRFGRATPNPRAAARGRLPLRAGQRTRVPQRRLPIVRRSRAGLLVSEPGLGTVALAQGSEYARWVQSALNDVMGLRLAITGILGPEARSAIRAFQQRHGLPVDGIAGPETKQALMTARGGPRAGAASGSTSRTAGAAPPPDDSSEPEPEPVEPASADEFADEFEWE